MPRPLSPLSRRFRPLSQRTEACEQLANEANRSTIELQNTCKNATDTACAKEHYELKANCAQRAAATQSLERRVSLGERTLMGQCEALVHDVGHIQRTVLQKSASSTVSRRKWINTIDASRGCWLNNGMKSNDSVQKYKRPGEDTPMLSGCFYRTLPLLA